jgi:hypothetical protein
MIKKKGKVLKKISDFVEKIVRAFIFNLPISYGMIVFLPLNVYVFLNMFKS